MKKITILFILIVCLIFNSASYASDIRANYKGLEELKELRIVNCYEDGSFRANNNITRAEFCKIISKISGITEGKIKIDCEIFSDVPMTHWANEYITFCYINDLVCGEVKSDKIFVVTTENGEETEIGNLEIKEDLSQIHSILESVQEGVFNPDEYITYQDAMKILIKVLGYESVAERYGNYPNGYMYVARQHNLISSGINGTDFLTRGDAVEIIYNALHTPLLLMRKSETQIEYYIADGENGNEYVTLYTKFFDFE